MRILGISRKDWINYLTGKPKLEEDEFITFRFSRRDRDWEVEEVVQIVYKPRTKEREVLGIAEIIKKEPRRIFKTKKLYHTPIIQPAEAQKDGFPSYFEMGKWFVNTYGMQRLLNEPMNKLTLRWVERREFEKEV